MTNAQAERIRKVLSLREELLRRIEQERQDNSATYVTSYPDLRDKRYEAHADHPDAR